jgi:hypothetical protein
VIANGFQLKEQSPANGLFVGLEVVKVIIGININIETVLVWLSRDLYVRVPVEKLANANN